MPLLKLILGIFFKLIYTNFGCEKSNQEFKKIHASDHFSILPIPFLVPWYLADKEISKFEESHRGLSERFLIESITMKAIERINYRI